MALDRDVLGRLIPPRADKETPDLTVLSSYCNRLLEYARPDDMLHAIGAVPGTTSIRVTYIGSPHLDDVMKHTGQFRFAVPACSCGMPNGEHLCTTSLDWIPSAFSDLKRMLSKGLNHVPCADLDVSAVCDVHAAVAEAVAGVSYVAAAREWALQTLAAAPVESVDAVHVTKDHPGVQYIMQRCFVSCVDKAANQPMFICKHLALTMALRHCIDTPSFEHQAVLPDTHVLSRDLRRIAPFLPQPDPGKVPRLATLYPVVKLHKTPVGWRMITSACGTVLHDAAVLLQATTACLIGEYKGYCALRNSSLRAFHRFNVQCCPLIQDGRVCLINVDSRAKYLCDFSADVDHCFDVIPHASLLDALNAVSARLRSEYGSAHNGKEPSFVCSVKVEDGHLAVTSVRFTHRKPSPAQRVLSVDAWMSLCSAVVSNCFVQVADKVFRVTAGIPQGLHCSPDWCNLFLLHHEVQFVLNHPADAHDVLLHWFRQVDDVRVVVRATRDNVAKGWSCAQWHAHLHSLLSRIYPAPLNLSLTCALSSDPESPFLCETGFLDIKSSLLLDGTLQVELIRKEQKLPIPVCQYVHLDSNRPVSQCYSVIVSLVISAVWHNSAPGPLFHDLLFICKKFIANGHDKARVIRKVTAALQRDYSYLNLGYDPAKLWLSNQWRVRQALDHT